MNDKSQALFNQLREAYRTPEMQAYPQVQQMMLNAGRKLDVNVDDGAYRDAVAGLAHNLAQFDRGHHDLPESAVVIYAVIKGDVPRDCQMTR